MENQKQPTIKQIRMQILITFLVGGIGSLLCVYGILNQKNLSFIIPGSILILIYIYLYSKLQKNIKRK